MKYLGTFLGFKVYADPSLAEGEMRICNDAQLTNEMLELEKRFVPSAVAAFYCEGEQLRHSLKCEHQCRECKSLEQSGAMSPPSSIAASDPLATWLRENAPDCGDNSCLFGGKGKGGMRTNGGCRCFKDLPTAKRIYVERLYAALSSTPQSAIQRGEKS